MRIDPQNLPEVERLRRLIGVDIYTDHLSNALAAFARGEDVQPDDGLTYDDGYRDGWDDGRLWGHYLEWGEKHAAATGSAYPCTCRSTGCASNQSCPKCGGA